MASVVSCSAGPVLTFVALTAARIGELTPQLLPSGLWLLCRLSLFQHRFQHTEPCGEQEEQEETQDGGCSALSGIIWNLSLRSEMLDALQSALRADVDTEGDESIRSGGTVSANQSADRESLTVSLAGGW